jgi:hypothetical protein
MRMLPKERARTSPMPRADELDAYFAELYELAAAAPHYDFARSSDLQKRVDTFVRERKLKGLKPLQVMIASLLMDQEGKARENLIRRCN